MFESITINADSVQEAIEKGKAQLGLNDDQITVRVINEGKKGFLGFGKQDAIVEISANNPQSIRDLMNDVNETTDIASSMDDSESSQAEELEVETPLVEENKVVETSQLSEVISNDMTQEASVIEAEETEEGQEETEPSSNQHHDLHLASSIVADFLIDVIREYGAKADIDVESDGNNVVFNIDTDKSGLIIGKHGKIINSLQILAQTLLHYHYKHRASVTLNVGDYRDRRANVLEQMAQRTAEEVLKTKQPVILDSLPAYERKQIHAYLSNMDHISTHSEGKDPNRYLVVEYVNE